MNIDPSIFKSYDIRAVYPTQIDEQKIVQITKAIYKVIQDKSNKKKLKFAISRDMRVSSPSLFKSAMDTLISLGADVVDLGESSTPNLYYSVYANKYDAGMQISASHNPKDYNGVKIVMNSPNGLIKIGKSTGMDDIKKYATEGVEIESTGEEGTLTENNTLTDEVQNALRIAGNPQLKKFKIVADAANSMGATYLNELFKNIPADVIRMNFELDGTFPAHQPDPLNYETLKDLMAKVLEEKADVGFAPDGDGDRFFFIDEKGEVVPPSIITSLVSRELLKKYPGETILFDIRYIYQASKIIEENGGKYDITKVGHAFITEKMTQTGAIFAGESSCHFFFRETGNGESPIPVILMVLDVMTRENKTLSQITEELRRAYESGEFNFKVTNAPEIMSSLKEKYKDGELNEMDGIAISYPTWRLSVRTSNTEPLLRLNIESYDKSEMEANRDEVMGIINSVKKE